MSAALGKSTVVRATDIAIYVALGLFALSTLFPLYYVFVVSVTPFKDVLRHGGFIVFPEHVTWEAYRTIFGSPVVPQAIKVTVLITVVGTVLNVLLTLLTAYPLSKKKLWGRTAVLFLMVFTMLFSGGIIPLYLTVRALGLFNTVWALIIPTALSTFNMLIVKTYLENLPAEVEEAARVDGAGDLQTLFRIVLPLSKPVIATVALFYAVTHWNSYFAAIMYITNRDLYPIQVVLRNMIQSQNLSNDLSAQYAVIQTLPPETIKMATVCVAILPILVVYPFLQRYFVQGATLGSVKG
ncbi:carbohydrate ABC transporter permease [Paenibacillus cymbidii]|uniref:carbohydrate ABC transporter permease n=1 Tax=Paenibacillus cymbidii TaxID=1639034 RepID=UPI0010818FE4|nr:carbohydrate ABC transporter permease [Paenibacillus cymbidii]